MKFSKNQSGFAGLEVVLLVVVLAIVGYMAVKAYDANQTANEEPTKQSTEVSDVPSAPSINSASDLTAVENTLDRMDLESSSESAELDTQLAAF